MFGIRDGQNDLSPDPKTAGQSKRQRDRFGAFTLNDGPLHPGQFGLTELWGVEKVRVD